MKGKLICPSVQIFTCFWDGRQLSNSLHIESETKSPHTQLPVLLEGGAIRHDQENIEAVVASPRIRKV